MNIKSIPLLIVDDDFDDLELMQAALTDLSLDSNVTLFDHPDKLIDYIRSSSLQRCIILSDYNMPKMNGLTLFENINTNFSSQMRGLAFVIWSTALDDKARRSIAESRIDGYFLKPTSFTVLRERLDIIYRYWHHHVVFDKLDLAWHSS